MNKKEHRGKVWQTFPLNFSMKQFVWEAIKKQKKGFPLISRHLEDDQLDLGCASYYQPTFRCWISWWNILFSVWQLLLNILFFTLHKTGTKSLFAWNASSGGDNGCGPRWDFHPFLNASASVRFSITRALWNVKSAYNCVFRCCQS